MFLKNRKYFLSVLIFIWTVFSVQAASKKETLFNAVKTASKEELTEVLKKNKDIINISLDSTGIVLVNPAMEFNIIQDGSKTTRTLPITEEKRITPLMAAILYGRDISIIKLLLEYGADPAKKDSQSRNSVMYSAQFSDNPQILKTLIEFEAALNSTRKRRILSTDKSKDNSIHYARLNKNPAAMLNVLKAYFKPEEFEKLLKADEEKEERLRREQEEEELKRLKREEEEAAKTLSAKSESNTPPVYVEEQTETEEEAAPEETSQEAETAEEEIPALEPPVTIITSMEQEEEQPPEEDISAQTQETEEETETALNEKTDETSGADKKPFFIEKIEPPEVQPPKRVYLFDYATLDEETDRTVEDKNFDENHIFIENPDLRDIHGRTRLMKAARGGDLELVENLIFSGCDVNLKDSDGWTALMFAARFSSNLKVVQTLILNGADVKTHNNFGISALKLASAFNKNIKIVSELLSRYSISETEVRGAFIYAISSDAPTDVLELFTDKGLPVNSSYDGKTPLMYAAESNKDTKIIDWLLSKGAKTTYKTSDGMTAYDFAKRNRNLKRDDFYWSLNAPEESR